MKKHLLMMAAALLLAVNVQARVITPKDGQVWWGYFYESDFDKAENNIGTGSAMTLMAGIYIPEKHEQLGKATIKAVRIYVDQSAASSLSNLKLWISKELPNTLSDANYTQNTLGTLRAGINDFSLTTPFEIKDESFYIGYSVKSTTGFFIKCGGTDAPNAFWIGNPSVGMDWDDLNGLGFGKLAFQILVEGAEIDRYCATPEDFKPAVVGLGETVDVPVTVTNKGLETIKELSYTITVDGKTSEEQTVASLSIPFGGSKELVIPFMSAENEGAYSYTFTITKINGEPNVSPNNTSTGKITTVRNLKTWPRNVLIEEFTTEYCGYCPQAASGLASFMKTYPDLAERVAVACHHDGYYTDWLTVSASTSYVWFYGDDGSYAPAFMYDRFAWDGLTPVESRQANAAGYKSRVEARIANVSYANIDLEAVYNEDKTKINVTANCERGWDFSTTPARITLFLTEDNITAKSQAGASGTFIHQHVLRAVNTTWGKVLSWDDNKATYTYTFNLNSAWKKEDLKVIAFISGYNSKDITDCVVENVTSVVPSDMSTPVNTLKAADTLPQTIYSVDGRKLSTAEKGINIVRMNDGTVKKVLVK